MGIWSGNPCSVYTLDDKVFIDGAMRYDRFEEAVQQTADFEVAQPALEDAQ